MFDSTVKDVVECAKSGTEELVQRLSSAGLIRREDSERAMAVLAKSVLESALLELEEPSKGKRPVALQQQKNDDAKSVWDRFENLSVKAGSPQSRAVISPSASRDKFQAKYDFALKSHIIECLAREKGGLLFGELMSRLRDAGHVPDASDRKAYHRVNATVVRERDRGRIAQDEATKRWFLTDGF